MPVIALNDAGQELSPWHYQQLETGSILFFPRLPLDLPDEGCRVLTRQRQSQGAHHKNIAYKPSQDVVTGLGRESDREHVYRILKDYCHQTEQVFTRLMPRYARSWRLDYTSFRPFEEAGRRLSLHARNDLLHIDAFPTRPTNGDRILRFFTNINPTEPRVWLTTEPFEALAPRLADEAGLLQAARRRASRPGVALARLARWARLPQGKRPPYDILMHRLHNFMKENRAFQERCPKERIEFPPKSSWMVFTDTASHAAIAGRYALEQTFIVARHALLLPGRAPVSILERLTGVPLTWGR